MIYDFAKKRGLPMVVISCGDTKLIRLIEPVNEYVTNPKARAAIAKQKLKATNPAKSLRR